ncbi:MAG: Mu transposase C-terminal domain-containing protein [Burkholderiales bacterium]|nr:Mu transposase C-terminal domain-containing protein [Burkholderiales bacterium]
MSTPGQHDYFRNAVLVRDDNTKHRLLRLDVQTETCAHTGEVEYIGNAWLILLDAPLALPYKVSYSELQASFQPLPRSSEKPALAKSDLFKAEMLPLSKPPSAASLRLSQRALARIEPLVDNPDIFEPSKRHALLVERSKQSGCGTPKTLLKDLRNWWQGGQTQDALLGNYSNCAHPHGVGTAGRGRKKTKYLGLTDHLEVTAAQEPESIEDQAADSHPVGKSAYQLTETDLEYMKEAIERYYFDKEVSLALTKVLQRLHQERYSYLDGNGVSYLRPSDECPSYRQLHHYLHSHYPLHVIQTARKGEKRFALEDRSTEGSIQLECHGVGHLYEFDATILDLPLVSSADRALIVGKPTLYLIIDRHSRLIVGWYLGFENANFSAAMQAILSIGQDKEELCRTLGIPYDPADWPAHGVVPESFLADQGELVHKKARRIARSLRSTISNVPGMRPDWKPLAECSFSMIHQIIAPTAPGFTADAENRSRRAVNRTRHIALTLLEATRLIVCAIIAHNKSAQPGYPLSLEQAADGVRPIPRELWRHNIIRRMGVLDQMDYEKLREELMPRSQATVSEDGIFFEGMYYSCPEATKRGWLVEGRRRRQKLEVAFDYRLVDEIIVYAPDGSGESFVAKLTGDSVMFVGLSQKEVKDHFSRVRSLVYASSDDKRQAHFEYELRTAPTREEAVRQVAEQTKGMSRTSRRADTAPTRKAELRAERQSTAGVRRTNDAAPEAQAKATSVAKARPAERGAKVIPLNAKPGPVAGRDAVAIDCSTHSGLPDVAQTAVRPYATALGGASKQAPLSQRLAELRRSLVG